jgi:predicted nucleic acid-binding protein
MLWGGSPKLLLQARREKRGELYTSTPLLAELTDILSRRKFEKKIAASLLTIDQLVDHYADLAQVVQPTVIPRIAPDPDDDVGIGYCSRWPSIRASGPSAFLKCCGWDDGG